MDNSSFSIAMSRRILGKSVEDVITPLPERNKLERLCAK